jgi:hypothetical protein
MGLAFGALAAGAFGLGVGIGFVWGELKSHREMEFAERRKEIGRLRQAQNKIPGNVRKKVRTKDPK